MAYMYTTTHIVFEVGDKVTPDRDYFWDDEVMREVDVLTIKKIIDGDDDSSNRLEFEEVPFSYISIVFRLTDDTNIREIH